MTKRVEYAGDPSISAPMEIELTPAMIRAGVSRLLELEEAGTSSAYVVEEVVAAVLSGKIALRLGEMT